MLFEPVPLFRIETEIPSATSPKWYFADCFYSGARSSSFCPALRAFYLQLRNSNRIHRCFAELERLPEENDNDS